MEANKDLIPLETPMITEKSWEEFRSSKLLWWINRTLQLFGWVIVYDYDKDDKITRVYPARTRFRGFVEDPQDWKVLSVYLKDNIKELVKECDD